jgi:hypothetical protein
MTKGRLCIPKPQFEVVRCLKNCKLYKRDSAVLWPTVDLGTFSRTYMEKKK